LTNHKERRETEKELKKIAGTLLLKHATTTPEGMRVYKRLERQIQKIVKDSVKVSRWQKIRQNLKMQIIPLLSLQQLDEELNMELAFRKKKREK